jgi:protein SSD1
MYWKQGVNPSTGQQQPWSLSDDEYEEEELLSQYPENTFSTSSKHTTASSDESEPPVTKRASKRASIISARLSTSTAYSSEQCSQTIKALDKVRVMITIEMIRTPPLIRIFAANPYA